MRTTLPPRVARRGPAHRLRPRRRPAARRRRDPPPGPRTSRSR